MCWYKSLVSATFEKHRTCYGRYSGMETNEWCDSRTWWSIAVTCTVWESAWIFVKNRELAEQKYLPLLVWYYYRIPKSSVVSAVQHGAAIKRPCAGPIVSMNDIVDVHIAAKYSLKKHKTTTLGFLELRKNGIVSIQAENNIAQEDKREWD